MHRSLYIQCPLTLLRRCVVCLRLDASHRHGRRGAAHARPRPRTPPAALVRRAGSRSENTGAAFAAVFTCDGQLLSFNAGAVDVHARRQTGAEVCVIDLGVDLDAMYYGTELPVTLTPPRMLARHLGVKICGAETCYIGVMSPNIDSQGPTSLRRPDVNFLLKKGLNCKKLWLACGATAIAARAQPSPTDFPVGGRPNLIS